MGDVVLGLDLAELDQAVDWRRIADAGYLFAALWASPPRAEALDRHWRQATDAGLLVSAIHTVDPSRTAASQIDEFIQAVGDRRPDLPMVLSVALPADQTEGGTADPTVREPRTGAPAGGWQRLIAECAERLMRAGFRRPVILTSATNWEARVDSNARWGQHDLWVDQDQPSATAGEPRLPRSWQTRRFWRVRDEAGPPGLDQKARVSRFAGSRAELLAYAEHPPFPQKRRRR